MTSQHKKLYSIILKIVIVLFAGWFIYQKLVANNDLKQFKQLLLAIPKQQIIFVLSVAFLLMLLNWGLEAIKWQKLVRKVEQISLWRAIESVFCGLTWAIFTPNRIGEYGGRVFFLSPKRRITGVVAMAVGNFAQLVLTIFFGTIAITCFIYKFTAIEIVLFLTICTISTGICLFFIIFYFNVKWLNGLLLSIKFTRKYKKFYAILARYKTQDLLNIILLSLGRYFVFSTQYFVMFNWLIPEIHYLDVVMLVSILFFIQSSLPSLDLIDIGIRSVTGLFFFKFVTDQNTAVVACIASIWLINIIIPAILGSYFVFKLNFFGNPRSN